jgi:hypothetical protein
MDVPMPPAMAARVAGQDAADRRQAENDAYAAADEAVMRRRVADHVAHVFEAQTGYTEAEWFHAQQQMAWARGDLGWDANATPGTAAHPEVLVDGQSLPRPAAPGTARRHESADDGLAARVAAEAEAGARMIARHRSAARQREIARLECELAAERRVPAAPRRLVVRAEAGPPSSRTAGGPAPLAMPEAAPYLPVDW